MRSVSKPSGLEPHLSGSSVFGCSVKVRTIHLRGLSVSPARIRQLDDQRHAQSIPGWRCQSFSGLGQALSRRCIRVEQRPDGCTRVMSLTCMSSLSQVRASCSNCMLSRSCRFNGLVQVHPFGLRPAGSPLLWTNRIAELSSRAWWSSTARCICRPHQPVLR